MYAVPALPCDASTTLMGPGGRSFGVTFVQVAPRLRVTCTRPVLVPTQITSPAIGEIAIAWIEPPVAGPLTVLPPAAAPGASATPLGAARSGLIVFQVCPRSADAITYCAAM